MGVQFTADHEAFRQAARGVLGREVTPHADEWEDAGIFPAHELFKALGTAGLLGLEYDPAYGGQGADHSYTVVLGEELGRMGCAGVAMAIAVQNDMATPSLHNHGSHELKQRYLAPALRGEMVAAIAVTEPDAGSDVAGIRTRAERDGDDWVINGSKLYITNGTQADWLCLLARTSAEGGYRGMSQIVFPTDTPGFSVSRKLRKLGNKSSDTAELSFTDARVPVSNTIGEIGRGFQQQMTQFQNERMIAAYMAVGGMDRALSADRRLPARPADVRRPAAVPAVPAVPAGRAGRRPGRAASTTTTRAPRPTSPARTPPGSRRSPSSRPGGCTARSPTPACSSTAASATWRRAGCPATSGTAG